jgi:hypothetical protein
MTSINVPSRRPTAFIERGFGLLQVILLIGVMAGLASIGYLQQRATAVVDASRQERQALVQADQAIVAFATVERRLPCPDTDRDGTEDCAVVANQKGWLPSTTLRLAGADSGVDVGQLRYLVQRGAGDNSLSVLTDAWRPLEYDPAGQTFFSQRAGAYPTDILTLTDFCQRLETARTTPLAAGLAQVNAATARTVAYALAHPGNGDADGDGDLFDGANANAPINADQMEDPARRPVLALYNDLVQERSVVSLQADLQCRPLLDSINTVALGHDLATQVSEMRAGNIDAATRAVAFSALASVMTTLEIALTVAEGISDAGNAAAEWVTCAASLGLAVNACAAAPQHTVAIGLAGGVVIANTAAVAANIAAAVIAGQALTLADSGATPAQVCPPQDTTLLNQSLTSAQAEVTAAVNARAAVQTEIVNKTTELNAANVARTASIATFRSAIRGVGASSQIDSLVDPLLTATGNWGTSSYSRDVALGRQTQATTERDFWAAEVADPTVTGSERDNAVAQLAAAQAVLTTATATYNAAQTSFGTAQTTYQSAYANLSNGAGRYAIFDGVGGALGFQCTTGCLVGDVDVSAAFATALADLVGSPATTTPNVDAKYLKPVKIQNEIDALNTTLVAAQTRETNAQNQLAQIQTIIANPGACNVTGSAATPMTPANAEAILISVDRKGGAR